MDAARLAVLVQDVESGDAYIANARHHLDLMRSTVQDSLTSKDDAFLKRLLLRDLDAVETNIEKALA